MTARATFAATSRYAVTFEHLLTTAETAARFGVDRETVARWAREGRIASVKTPGAHGQRRYRAADVEAALAKDGA